MIVLLLVPLLTTYLASIAYNIAANYYKVAKLGLPIIIAPISPDNPLWIAIQTAFGRILRHFPFAASSFARHCRLGWEFHDRYQTHLRLGDAWILVTPVRNWLYVANAEAITDIFSRGRDFSRPVWMLEVLIVSGPNISTSEGPDWQRQRKLTSGPFNETKSHLVWNEALSQATDMATHWRSPSSTGRSTAKDTRTLALDVLAYVAFQKSYPFDSATPKTAESFSYRDSLAIILENAIIAMVLPESGLSFPLAPGSWKRIGAAIRSFRGYMAKQVEDERQLMDSGSPGTGNLVSNLVHASGEVAGMNPLTDAEIFGNIFVFNFAGHDTTAISLAFAMLLLVANPEVQDWIQEEIRYYANTEDLSTLEYNKVFPKLKRCLAVLMETLRLYNPLPGVPKYRGKSPTTLTVNNKTYSIPADVLVVPALQAQHTHPRHWGSDSLDWRPQRWITSHASQDLASEVLFQPPKGTFFAWSEGLRNCPGKKLAQVEFVAVMVGVFGGNVAEPVCGPGESMKDARRRVLEVVKDSNVELLLQMRDPGSVEVRLKKRETRS
ncbi:putative cytochrome P450 CYP13A1 [Lachnellula suecica]|uniref:Putative cytochrome P450 CYP13A1 n=1 Tax=Lachnellula suecica TaxID=602035 RepID=A0A8T9CLR3_9HELO|nr:putative cytochrome P450 CYP13A1 [Lachnellula suecica]